MNYHAGTYDVIVIGAGHAGIEAALASARLGCKTVIFTINMDAVGNCPCNPSIGGTAKGHLVREIDALGGEMGRTADASFIQSRMLNLGKGPAVHSLRAQIDRREYSKIMKHKLELQENLHLKQAEIISIDKNEDGTWQAVTQMNAVYQAKAVIIATGTFLGGRIYVGEVNYAGGPDGLFPANQLGDSLKHLGLRLRRFKTGTPARVLRSSIDFTNLEEQHGDEPVVPFSYDTLEPGENKVTCHVAWTNEDTKKVILENIHRSPLYSGQIEGVGPRYCPSLEDKIVRFADKERHQVFIEPCGLDTEEMYLQGMSSSLPEEIQLAFYRTVKGLEHVEIMRCAYAIEYDCVDPLQMEATLEFQDIPGLYGAGQFNGSSGYEEAAAQGLIGGINAAMHVMGRPPLILDRSEAYAGVLIDDLVTRGSREPYRMMTSRAEYRLLLRQDNADERLTEKGYEAGLISEERYRKFLKKQEMINNEIERVNHVSVTPREEIQQLLDEYKSTRLKSGAKLSDLIKRPELDYFKLEAADPERPELPFDVKEEVNIKIKYEGYIKQQMNQVEQFKKMENKLLPPDIDYKEIKNLRIEAMQKLSDIRPASIGQASRITGVSPADITVLLIYMEQNKKRSE